MKDRAFIVGTLFKFDILKHPNVSLTADGHADVYRHGEVKDDIAIPVVFLVIEKSLKVKF